MYGLVPRWSGWSGRWPPIRRVPRHHVRVADAVPIANLAYAVSYTARWSAALLIVIAPSICHGRKMAVPIFCGGFRCEMAESGGFAIKTGVAAVEGMFAMCRAERSIEPLDRFAVHLEPLVEAVMTADR